MAVSSLRSSRMPVGPYWYENLGEDEFQKLCGVLIASKFDKVTCYLVGQKDGGRDVTQKTDVVPEALPCISVAPTSSVSYSYARPS